MTDVTLIPEPELNRLTDPLTPSTEVAAWLTQRLGRPGSLRRDVLSSLGELLLATADDDREVESENSFSAKALEIPTVGGHTVVESRDLTGVSSITSAMALAEWIAEHDAPIGPCRHTDPPRWTTSRVGDDIHHHPQDLRAAFRAGSLHSEAPCVIAIDVRPNYGRPTITAVVRPEHQDVAQEVLDRLEGRAVELSPFKGRVCQVSSSGLGLSLNVIDLPEGISRKRTVVPPLVWDEISLGVASILHRQELMKQFSLGCRRACLLVGPPGCGKSLVSAVIAKELVAEGVTVLYVDARAGERLLTDVMAEARNLEPSLVVLEDIDLFVSERGRMGGGGGLSELLQAMDGPDSRVLTLASCNALTIDAAGLRTGRMDSILEVPYPGKTAMAEILTALLHGIPGGGDIDTVAVASVLPDGSTSGSDIRELVRRTVLLGGSVSTAALLAEVGVGRYKAAPVGGGTYL